MKRYAPLLRRTPLRRRFRSTKYARRRRDVDFMRWCKRLPCSVREEAPDPEREPTTCCGRVEADHMGYRALSHKADDTTCAPMCEQHHRERTDHSGSFKHVTKAEMRAWRARAIRRTRLLWKARPK